MNREASRGRKAGGRDRLGERQASPVREQKGSRSARPTAALHGRPRTARPPRFSGPNEARAAARFRIVAPKQGSLFSEVGPEFMQGPGAPRLGHLGELLLQKGGLCSVGGFGLFAAWFEGV